MKDKLLQLKLLTINAFRILWKSKVLVIQLVLLLLIAVTVLVTIVLSNDSLQASKSNIINNGNLANLTVSIPQNIVDKSINQANSKLANSQSKTYLLGQSPADAQLQEELDKLGLQYSITKTLNMSDMLSHQSFILTNTQQPSTISPVVVNKLVLDPGSSKLPSMIYTNANMPLMMNGFKYFTGMRYVLSDQIPSDFHQMFTYEDYMKNQPWNFAKALENSIWYLDTGSIQNFINVVNPLAQVPTKENFDKDYNLFKVNASGANTNQINTNSYWYKWRMLMGINAFTYNGYGFNIDMKENIPLLGPGAQLPFSVSIQDLSSYFAVVSSNFIRANTGVKAFIPKKTLEQALKLPFKTYTSFDTNTNPATSHLVYNPETGKEEAYPDFLTWLSELPNKYKVSVNSFQYVLIGSGMTPDLMYPILNSNQLLVNNKDSGVLYVNSAGFARATYGNSNKPELYYAVRYPPDFTHHEKKIALEKLQQFTRTNYGLNTAFKLNDSKQPNYLIYLRANFLDNLKNIILIITLIIALVIALLSLFFISTLLRSIVKQSKVTFGVGLANGISKSQLAVSFFPFALVPAIICGVFGYLIGYYLMAPMNGVYLNYWTVAIPHLEMQWWLYFIIPIIIFCILYLLILGVIYWTLRKNTQTILNSSSEFRMNWLIIHTKRALSKLNALSSFRWTFMMGNITRFFILTAIVFTFISLSTITVGSINEFQNALSYTNRNKQYTFAFNLYSPTINDGYYSEMPYSELGLSQQGFFNNYTTFNYLNGNYDAPNAPGNTFNYSGQAYANALADPYLKGKYFTSLFLPSNKVATELDHNIQFFNNKVFTKLALDTNVDIAGATINPWDVAKQIAPTSIISLADTYFQKQVQQSFDFYLWLQNQNTDAINNINTPTIKGVDSPFNGAKIYYSTYLPNVFTQPFTLDGSSITGNITSKTNQSQWIFQKVINPLTEKYEWQLNQKYAVAGAPTYEAKVRTVALLVEMLTNIQNPLFQYWYKYVDVNNPNRGKANQVVNNYSYVLAQGAVPIEANDETYTYISAIIDKKNGNHLSSPFNATIYGIKPDSKYMILYDSHNKDLKPLLTKSCQDYQGQKVYPLIINEVVERKYGLKLGDHIQVLPENTYDRFNLINIGEKPYQNAETIFKVVGITDTKSEEQFYTTQAIANKVLGYQNFNTPNTPIAWRGSKNPGRGYVPFNGFFTNEKVPKFAMQFGGIYAPSGLTTSKGAWNTNIGNKPGQIAGSEQAYLVQNNLANMNEITSINEMVDYKDNNKIVPIPEKLRNPLAPHIKPGTPPANIPFDIVGNTIRHIVKLFGSTSPIVTQLQKVDTPLISDTIGSTIDTTLANIEKVIVTCLIPTLIIIIALLASMIVLEARRLIALMKVLGYSDLKNTFSFLFVYIIVLFLGTFLAVPFTYGILAAVKAIAFSAFNIIIAPVAPVWIYFVAFGAVALIFFSLFVYVWSQLKKIKLSQEISVR